MPAPPDALTLVRLAVKMRSKQVEFFRGGRDQAVLRQSKALEAEFDAKAAALLAQGESEPKWSLL